MLDSGNIFIFEKRMALNRDLLKALGAGKMALGSVLCLCRSLFGLKAFLTLGYLWGTLGGRIGATLGDVLSLLS